MTMRSSWPGTGAGALEAFQAARPLVVLLDLGLPPHPADPEEGLATLAELTALESLTKVIVITGQGEKGIGLRAIGGGAYDFMAKPVEMEELKIAPQARLPCRAAGKGKPPDAAGGAPGRLRGDAGHQRRHAQPL